VWLKPWGDEDGNVAACPLATPPDGRSVVELFVEAGSPLGSSIVKGEMLEVSECFGKGFSNLAKLEAAKGIVCGFAHSGATVSLLLALRARAASAVEVRVVLFDDGDPEALYGSLACAWAEETSEQKRSVTLLTSDNPSTLSLDGDLELPPDAVAIIACQSDLLVSRLEDLGIECCVNA
jgi:hypothetical protein